MIANRYNLIRPLGHGTFGKTFLARDESANRDVAIKVFNSSANADWKAYELFEREAAVLRSLRHHGIPEIIDSFRDQWEGKDSSFLVLEYVEGKSLGQLIDEHQHIEQDRILHLFLELLGILEYIHGRLPPILHRDIKPSNIIIRPTGYPSLVDFGSVRRVFLAPEESGSTVAGTYGYMPYEQYMGQASPASDLFSVAATMLHLVTGRAPRDFMNSEGRIEPPDDLPGGERFRMVITRMLKPAPTDRYQGAAEVRRELLSTAPVAALVPAAKSSLRAQSGASLAKRSPRVLNVQQLPAAPRPLEGITRERFDQVAYPWWRYADASSKVGDEGHGLLSLALFGFFSVITAGVMPAVFLGIGRTRRRRLKRFFKEGTQGIAEILSMTDSPTAFGEKLTRVSYEIEVDGIVHRDSDMVLPIVAARWREGDQIEVLFIPGGEFDSVIVTP